MIYILMRVLNVLFGLVELALILHVILQFFGLSSLHPVMRFLSLVTRPFVQPVRRMLGSAGQQYVPATQSYVDLAPMVALFVLWLVQLVLMRILGWIAAPPLWLLRPGEDFGRWLVGVINLLFQLYILALMIRVLLEWLRVSYAQPVMKFLWTITEPLLAPIRRRVPLYAGMDFSPVVAFLVLLVAEMLISSLIQAVF